MTTFMALIAGVVIGAAAMALLIAKIMPSKMVVTEASDLGFDETVTALQDGIAKAGWTSPVTINFNHAFARQGVDLKPRVTIVELCKAQYAKDVLETDRFVSGIMPCSLGVWEGDDGKVYVSKMNTGMMGKLFGGNIGRVIGQNVAGDELSILAGIAVEPACS
ncbi:MAG TPA: DUF302 domain-containing protein [Desulfuromonadales bacterium]|nr:DUF302 domain-containing protein [Desulfuromonadales bacterium]